MKVRTIEDFNLADVIRGMVTSFTNNDYVTDFKFGQEFQDTKTRTVIRR